MIHRQFYLNFYNNIFSFPLFYSSFSSLSKISISKLKISRIIFQYLCNCSTHHDRSIFHSFPFFYHSSFYRKFRIPLLFHQLIFNLISNLLLCIKNILCIKYYHFFVEKFECTFQYPPDNCSNFTSSHFQSPQKFRVTSFHYHCSIFIINQKFLFIEKFEYTFPIPR